MHICATDNRLATKATWCKTLGKCPECGGLVCEHGCQRSVHHGTAWIIGSKKAASHDAH